LGEGGGLVLHGLRLVVIQLRSFKGVGFASISIKIGEVLKAVIFLFPVILVWKIMGKYLKAVTNVKPVIFSSNTTNLQNLFFPILR
jgi:hypothetical protein